MERILLFDDAFARLNRLTQAISNPVITDDLEDILAQCQLAALWEASTLYKTGDVIQPNTPNGHRYICIVGGTSGATEPDWLETDVTATNSFTYRNTIIEDGTSDPALTWREDGAEYASLWDLRRAAYLGWELKASLAICAVDVKRGDLSVANSQIYDHCKKQALKFMPVLV